MKTTTQRWISIGFLLFSVVSFLTMVITHDLEFGITSIILLIIHTEYWLESKIEDLQN